MLLVAAIITGLVCRSLVAGEQQQLLLDLGVTEQQSLNQTSRPSHLLKPFEPGQNLFDLIKDGTEHLVLGH